MLGSSIQVATALSNGIVTDGLSSANSVTLKPSGDTDDYFTFATASNVPTIYGTGAYVRIGDAATTSQSLASEDDLLVTGKLEVDGTFFSGGAIEAQSDLGVYSRKNDNGYIQFMAQSAAGTGAEVARVQRATNSYFGIGASGIAIRTVAVTVDHATHGALNAAGVTDNFLLWTQPAGSTVLAIKGVLTERFVATSLTDIDFTLGQSGGDEDGWLVQTMNGTSDAVNTTYTTRGALWDTSAEGCFNYQQAAADMYIFVTATGANLNTLTAGTWTFYITYLDIP